MTTERFVLTARWAAALFSVLMLLALITASAAQAQGAITAAATVQFSGEVDVDPSCTGSLTLMIDWGDGTSDSSGAYDANGNVTGTHTYATSGTFPGKVIFADSCDTSADTFTATVNAAPQFKQCPPVFDDFGCQFLMLVSDNGTTIEEDTNQGPYEDSDDSLIGIVNNSSDPISEIPLSSPASELFGFDGDGICDPGGTPIPSGCVPQSGAPGGTVCPDVSCAFPIPPGEPAGYVEPGATSPYTQNGYEGPTTWFSNVSADTSGGQVNFSPALQPGQSTYFSLEEPPTAAGLAANSTPSAVSQGSLPPTVTVTGAQLSGLVNPNGSPTTAYFQYGTSLAYGTTTPPQAVGGDFANHALNASVSGLAPGTTYHYQLVATNANGSSFGPDETFTTRPGPPTVSAGPPTVSGQRATFNGSVDPGAEATTAHFEYGLDPKYSGGGPVVYTNVTPAVALGAGSTAVPVSQSVSGLVPNALYHVRLVASNSAGTATGPDQTFTTAALPNPPPPVLGQTENAVPVSGLVFVKFPAGKGSHAVGGVVKGKGFIPLTQARQIPVGSQIDARRGTLNLVVATTKKRHTNTARLGGGVFSLAQQRSGPAKGLSTLALLENAFSGAPSYSTCTAKKGKSVLAGIAKLSPKILQTLSVSDKNGKFRTKGRYSAATERGTFWETQDRCDGTLTIVKRGTVNVQDFRTRKTIIVHAGHSFLAAAAIAAKPKKKRKR
jgi:hypothetical protein